MRQHDVYLRPLEENDCMTSWRWRNDPDVWKYTGSRPDRQITPEIERAWIRGVLSDPTTVRFAICLAENDQYIGNVQLSGVNREQSTAEFHIFIGEKSHWGKGLGQQATRLLLSHAKKTPGLQTVHLSVNCRNLPAIRIYEKLGFVFQEETVINETPMKIMSLDLNEYRDDGDDMS